MKDMKKLYRSREDKKVAGLLGGLAQMMNIDATLLRVLFIITVVLTSGTLILIYLIACLVVPKEPIHSRFGPPGPGDYGYGVHGGNGGYGDYGSYGGNGAGPYAGQHAGSYGQQQQRPSGKSEGYYNPGFTPNGGSAAPAQSGSSNLDQMMEDIEKKALRRELEELRAKLAKYEKGDF